MDKKILHSLIGTTKYVESTYVQYAISTSTSFFTRVFIPHIPQTKLLPGMELNTVKTPLKPKPVRGSKVIISDEDQERSMRRTHQKVRDICFSNMFELFATFTFANDRGEINDDVLTQRMIDWLKNQKKYWGHFDYIIVKERQKDGTLHFHALMSGFKGKLKASRYIKGPNKGKTRYSKGRVVYNFTGYKSGYTTCVKIDDDIQSQQKVISYLVKYLTKDTSSFKGKKRYWTSRTLKRPIIEINPDNWYEKLKPAFVHNGLYGKTLYYTTHKVEEARS